MSKSKLSIIVLILLSVGVGALFFTGTIGPRGASDAKKMVEPIPLSEPFTVLLNDTDQARYAVIGIALQLEPMPLEQYEAFMGSSSDHGASSDAAPGVSKVASYPKFANAVVDAAGGFSRQELQSPEGKEQFKDVLRRKFVEIAEQDKSEFKSDDPNNIGPPFYVADVYFTKYIVQ